MRSDLIRHKIKIKKRSGEQRTPAKYMSGARKNVLLRGGIVAMMV